MPAKKDGKNGRIRDKRIDMQLGAKVRAKRQALRMSLEELGNLLGVTPQQVQKYERGTNAIAATRVPALCAALKMRPDDLFNGSVVVLLWLLCRQWCHDHGIEHCLEIMVVI